MLTYKEYEKAVFDWLITKNQNDPTFTFSLRQKGSKGSELDYFIGTEKSNYFGTTFWTIPLYYPGSSTDLINLFFGFTKKSNLWYSFEVRQTRQPEEEQNIVALSLAKKLKSRFKVIFPTYEESGETNKMEWCIIRSRKPEYENTENLFSDLEKDLEIFISIVNEELINVKSESSSFIGHGITTEEFKSFNEKMNRRIDKYGDPSLKNPDTGNSKPTTSDTNMTTNQPLNQILFGPPGTGKTYSTVEYAYKIINGDNAYKVDGYDKAKQWFKEQLAKADSDDRQLDFITFHQNYSYEDFVIGIKPDLNEGDGLSFTRHEGIFYKICQRALKNYEDSQKSIEVIKKEKSLEELFKGFRDSVSEYLEQDKDGVYPITDAINIVEVKDDAFVYVGHNWNRNTRGIQMKFKDIILIYNNENAKDRQSSLLTPEISGLAKNHISWYFKMVNEFKKFVKIHKGNIVKSDKKIDLKNYVIIIDEINRANISRVFGELITLIEDDKRWGNDNEMEVRLPDGHTKFTVPKNLYIIGTMNTADKSIALLDIALRRRFEFTALYPDSEKVNEKYKGFFEALNKDIIAKKGIDFTIGHSYFMTKNGQELDFVKTMNKKVIPLLCEYFYNIKDNKVVVKLIEDALSKASSPNKVVPNDYQICIE